LSLLVELLLQLLNTALLNLVGAKLLEVISETEELRCSDKPLGWVVLIPFNGVTVIAWKLVVEVVVSLAKSHEGSEDVIAGRVAVIEGLVAEPMGERVDAEGSLLDEKDTENTSVNIAASPVTPAEAGNKRWEDDAHDKCDPNVVLVLPDDNRVLVEIADVGTANSFGVLLHDHPTQVAVEEALANAVGIFGSVCVTVVGSVVAGPPSDAAFNSTGTTES